MASKMLRLPKYFLSGSKRFKSSSFHDQYKYALSQVPNTDVSATKNNVRVATQQLERNTTTFGIFVEGGSMYETADKNGAGNLVQRLVYKGSATRKEADIRAIASETGAALRAFTSRDRTGFYVTCANEDVPKLFELLADVVQNPRFDEADLEKEKAKTLKIMSNIHGNMKSTVVDFLHATAFQGTPLEQNIYGSVETLQSLKPDDLRNFIAKLFKPSRIVVASSGGTSHNQLAELTEKHVTKFDESFDGAPVEWTHCRFTGSEIRWVDRSVPYAYFALGFKAPAAGSKDSLKALIATSLYGSYTRSLGKDDTYYGNFYDLCHSYESFLHQYNNTGLFGFYGICEELKATDFSDALVRRLRQITYKSTDAQIEAAKNRLFTNYLQTIDQNPQNCLDIANSVLSKGYRAPLSEYETEASNTSADAVRDYMENWLSDKCFALSAVGRIVGNDNEHNLGVFDYLNLRMKMSSWSV